MADNESVKIVRLETQMSNVEQKIDKLDVKVERVITKIDHFTNLQTEVGILKEEIDELKRKTFRNAWLYPTMSAVAGAILTFLIIEYLTKMR